MCVQGHTLPATITWLVGPPGVGKGSHKRTIMAGLDATEDLTMSAVLASDTASRRAMALGDLVSDSTAAAALMRMLLRPVQRCPVQALLLRPQHHLPPVPTSAAPRLQRVTYTSDCVPGFATPPQSRHLVVDGFPRTAAQAALVSKLPHLFADACGIAGVQAPQQRVLVLDVDEATAVTRQRQRHTQAVAHNALVHASGRGHFQCAPV